MTHLITSKPDKSQKLPNDWTSGCHAIEARKITMNTDDKLSQPALVRATLEINSILVAADKPAMLAAYDSARTFVQALYDEGNISKDEAEDLDQDCAHARTEWETFGPHVGDETDQLPQLPKGLRTSLHVVGHKGMTGNKTWVLRDLESDELYELSPSTIEGWDIPEGQLDGPGIIVTMVPYCVTLQLSNGQLYRDQPPADALHLK